MHFCLPATCIPNPPIRMLLGIQNMLPLKVFPIRHRLRDGLCKNERADPPELAAKEKNLKILLPANLRNFA